MKAKCLGAAMVAIASTAFALMQGEDDLTVREFVAAARAAYPTEAYQSYTNTLVKSSELQVTEWRYDKFHDVPKGGRVSKCETTNDVRWVNVPGLRNVRDLGGWNGLRTGQVYRGSQLWNETDSAACATDEKSVPVARAARWKGGVFVHPTPETAVAIRELGWKTDLDLRGEDECRKPDQLPLLAHAPQMQLKNARMLTYIGSLQGRWADMRDALKVFCDEANYPIYFHCKAGADRTGTLAFFLEGICGCSQADIDIDYELTSVCGDTRVRNARNYNRRDRECILRMWECVKGYRGKTLEEKFANCAKHLWRLTDEDIATIRRMLKGNRTPSR